MDWYKEFYAGEGVAGKRMRIKWKILRHAGMAGVYVITLSSNPKNLLDIIPSWELMQDDYPKSGLLVVGVDRGYENAMELAGMIVMDVYEKTGTFQIREYFLEKHRKNVRRKHRWKSSL
ncbi:hypothetical protein V1226_13785 [Lachnospiraceae bacterium JLR.KK009]|jgi:hypothetical protein|nr:hypothetical protein C810_02488 [Lachnospiraceae bacterium A2]MCI8707087.1 hypothetical protein [Lachnospiraceae bacterium]MCI8883265.1 hypothetical protein [Lachnospiraceae bacterium]